MANQFKIREMTEQQWTTLAAAIAHIDPHDEFDREYIQQQLIKIGSRPGAMIHHRHLAKATLAEIAEIKPRADAFREMWRP
jgi:hypothetical protein